MVKMEIYKEQKGRSAKKSSGKNLVQASWLLIPQKKGGKKKPQAEIFPDVYVDLQKKLQRDSGFDGSGICFVRYGNDPDHILLGGLGEASKGSLEVLRKAGAGAYKRARAEKLDQVILNYESLLWSVKQMGEPFSGTEALEAVLEGWALSAYTILAYRSKSDPQSPLTLSVEVEGVKKISDVRKVIGEVRAVEESVRLSRDWVNEPPNYGTPEEYASRARQLAQKNGLRCKILGLKEAKAEKMGLLLSVAQGSVRAPRVVVLEYTPGGQKTASKKKTQKTVVLVGKGVTFDSGGISIKPSAKMEDMKHDMGGAGTVMGAILLAARLKVKHRVVAIMGFVENMPDAGALTPSSVITGRNGKTVEIINTDAEGRLVLADLLDYAQNYKPDYMIDLATLTGAVGYVLGNQCCGMYSNDDGLAKKLTDSGERSGELLWRLPLLSGYRETLKSSYADLMNCTSGAAGGTSTAAAFLSEFVPKGIRWAHMDIAYMAWDLGHVPYHPRKGATGCYVRSLARMIREL